MLRSAPALLTLGVLHLLPAGLACQQSAAPLQVPTTDMALGASAVLPPLGVYQLSGDPTTGLEFARLDHQTAALGDSFAVDITLLSATTFRFTGLRFLPPDVLRLEFFWEHPLPDTTNRRDLSVFDFRLHIMTPESGASFSGTGGLTSPAGAMILADLDVLNADGWSTWGQEVVEPAIGTLAPSVYPFILIHEDTGRAPVNPSSPAGWNAVPHGPGGYPMSFDMTLGPGQSLDLILALDASYGASALKAIANPNPGSRLNPRYLNPEFNVKEAWRVSAEVDTPIETGNPTSTATLTLTAFDHQGPLPASGAYDPITAPVTSLRYASHLVEAQVSIPGALTNVITVPNASFTGDGTPGDPYSTGYLLSGSQFSGTPGDYVGLVAFVDAMRASASETSPLPTKGFDRDSAVRNRLDFATYAVFPITLEPNSGPPTWTQVHTALIMTGDPNTGAPACVSCHIGGPNGLFMTPDKNDTYANLVNVASTCGDDYVEPGNPADSFMFQKVSLATPDCGDRMPQGGPYLSAAYIQMLSDWISAGAPNN